jgi:hypothetical protein
MKEGEWEGENGKTFLNQNNVIQQHGTGNQLKKPNEYKCKDAMRKTGAANTHHLLSWG